MERLEHTNVLPFPTPFIRALFSDLVLISFNLWALFIAWNKHCLWTISSCWKSLKEFQCTRICFYIVLFGENFNFLKSYFVFIKQMRSANCFLWVLNCCSNMHQVPLNFDMSGLKWALKCTRNSNNFLKKFIWTLLLFR